MWIEQPSLSLTKPHHLLIMLAYPRITLTAEHNISFFVLQQEGLLPGSVEQSKKTCIGSISSDLLLLKYSVWTIMPDVSTNAHATDPTELHIQQDHRTTSRQSSSVWKGILHVQFPYMDNDTIHIQKKSNRICWNLKSTKHNNCLNFTANTVEPTTLLSTETK